MSEIQHTTEQILDSLNQASQHEVDVRRKNNELYHLTQKGELTMDMLTEIDRVQADKARSILLGHAEANPQAVTAIQSMIMAGLNADDEVDTLEALAQILEELVHERNNTPDEAHERLDEIDALIDTVEKIFVVHATERRASHPQWWMNI